MRRRKTYSEFKRAGYRFPLVATFFNSTLVYFAFALVGVLAFTTIMFQGVQSFDALRAPVEKKLDYLPVNAAPADSSKWAEAFVAAPPPHLTKWEESKDHSPAQPFPFEKCSSLGLLPTTQYATASATGAEGRLLVQLYNPGQALVAFQEYKKALSTCWPVEESKGGEPQTTIYKYPTGFAFTYGDAIFFFSTDDATLRDNLLPWYLKKAATSLQESSCLSLTVGAGDELRNLFVQGSKYTGYLVRDTVNTKLNVENTPTQVFAPLAEVTPMDEPEAPLPATFAQVPQAPKKPVIPQDNPEEKKGFSKAISFQEVDGKGPGCGWAWSAQKAPLVDEGKLKTLKAKTYYAAQLETDTNARSYLDARLAFARQGFLLAPSIETWNSYVAEVEAVHTKWQWLKDERKKIKTPWYNYVEAYDDWINFDNRQANAQKDYNAEVQACTTAQAEAKAWDEQWGALWAQQEAEKNKPKAQPSPQATPQAPTPTSPTPSGTASPTAPNPTPSPTATTAPPTPEPTPSPTVKIPPRPEGCSTPPAAPSIITETKGSEPQPPARGDEVTIPNSWPKPLTAPSVPRR